MILGASYMQKRNGMFIWALLLKGHNNNDDNNNTNINDKTNNSTPLITLIITLIVMLIIMLKRVGASLGRVGSFSPSLIPFYVIAQVRRIW